MLSIMLCTSWVCAGTFEDHEWVSESRNFQHMEELMGMGLQNWYPVCGTLVHVMVFSANKVKSNIGKTREKIAKYDETVNMAIAYATSRPFGGQHTPGRAC